MFRSIFDFEDGDMIFQTSDNTAMDIIGHLMTRMSDNMAMDLDTGELHMISSWNNDDDEEW